MVFDALANSLEAFCGASPVVANCVNEATFDKYAMDYIFEVQFDPAFSGVELAVTCM